MTMKATHWKFACIVCFISIFLFFSCRSHYTSIKDFSGNAYPMESSIPKPPPGLRLLPLRGTGREFSTLFTLAWGDLGRGTFAQWSW